MSEREQAFSKTKEGKAPNKRDGKNRASRIRKMERGYRKMGLINLQLAESAVFADEELHLKIEQKLAEREKVWS